MTNEKLQSITNSLEWLLQTTIYRRSLCELSQPSSPELETAIDDYRDLCNELGRETVV